MWRVIDRHKLARQARLREGGCAGPAAVHALQHHQWGLRRCRHHGVPGALDDVDRASPTATFRPQPGRFRHQRLDDHDRHGQPEPVRRVHDHGTGIPTGTTISCSCRRSPPIRHAQQSGHHVHDQRTYSLTGTATDGRARIRCPAPRRACWPTRPTAISPVRAGAVPATTTSPARSSPTPRGGRTAAPRSLLRTSGISATTRAPATSTTIPAMRPCRCRATICHPVASST